MRRIRSKRTSRRKVLLLNRNYTPVGIVSWRKAVNLVLGRGKAHTLVEYADSNRVFDVAVIRLVVESPDPFRMFEKQKFSKRNVFLRDRHSCQYCAKQLPIKELTIDHVRPRAKGGGTSYLNCVTSCKRCNSTKGDFTLDQCGMRLLKPIRRPNIYDVFHTAKVPDEWHDFLGKLVLR
jgi:hypothetical protein